ncbi:sigma 54-interacting transcriptional regulator [Thermodesulfobacteriota bacterium]
MGIVKQLAEEHGPIHFSVFWFAGADWNPEAPQGMRLWARILDQYKEVPDNRYTWFGKLSFSKSLGLPRNLIKNLNEQIQVQNSRGLETHLYLYTSGSNHVPDSLHVGKVLELKDQRVFEDRKEREHMPWEEFYKPLVTTNDTLKEHRKDLMAVPFFFKIEDLREVPITEAANVRRMYLNVEPNPKLEPFNLEDQLSPALIFEKRPRIYFDDAELRKSRWIGWWEEILITARLGELAPGQFKSGEVRKCYAEALRYAAWPVPVLICGERGTGKSFMARFIRRHSKHNRLGKYATDWPSISCAALSNEERLQSVLFGYRRGEYPWAFEDSDGLIAAADGDTLHLADVESLPAHLQRAIINAYEDGSYTKADYGTKITSNFRLILSTSVPPGLLAEKLDIGLLDRVPTVLVMPSLEGLPAEDIQTIWRHVYDRTKAELGGNFLEKPLNEKEPLLVECLNNHRLPGNFHDLRLVAVRTIEALTSRNRPGSSKSGPSGFSPNSIVREALDWRGDQSLQADELTKIVALAYAHGELLEVALSGRLQHLKNSSSLIACLTKELKRYLAEEIHRIQTTTGTKVCKKPSPSQLSRWRAPESVKTSKQVTDE